MCVIVLQWKCSLAISKWRKWKLGHRFLRFLRFFDMTLQKNVKKRILWKLEWLCDWLIDWAWFNVSTNTAGPIGYTGDGMTVWYKVGVQVLLSVPSWVNDVWVCVCSASDTLRPHRILSESEGLHTVRRLPLWPQHTHQGQSHFLPSISPFCSEPQNADWRHDYYT